MRTLTALLLALGLTLGVLGCVGPGSPRPSPSEPGDGPTLPIQPSVPRPTGPSSTIEVPPPIR